MNRALADTKSRGSLDLADFTVGMYLIQASMSGQLGFVPTTLPPGLYEQAGGVHTGVAAHHTGSSGMGSPGLGGGFPNRPGNVLQPQHTGGAAPMLQQQYTGQGIRPTPTGPPLPSRPSTNVGAAAAGSSAFGLMPQMTGQAPAWDVTPAEKASADRFFDTLDTHKQGYIEGEVAVPFMLQSNLPEEVLAQVWCVIAIIRL